MFVCVCMLPRDVVITAGIMALVIIAKIVLSELCSEVAHAHSRD